MKTIIIFIMSIFLTSSLLAQTTTIPDTAFEKALVQIGVDSDGLINGQILNSDAAAITNLDVSYWSINSLTGISAFVNLDSLNCSSNDLTSLSTTANLSLKYLDCSRNDITSLNVTSNSALKYLDCSYNDFTSLNITNNTALAYLICTKTYLTTINVTANIALKHLNCEELYSSLTSLNVTNNTALEYLNCENNDLTALTTLGNPNLRNLNCSYNPITSLNLNNNPLLDSLSANGTDLTSLNLSNNQLLKYLFVSYTDMLSLNLSNNPLLKKLYCINNNFTSLDLSNNPLLEILYCEGGDLTSINLPNNPRLIDIHCSDNNLTSLDVTSCTDLWIFYCKNNNLTSLDISQNLDLVSLNCEGNNLSHLDASQNVVLDRLFCSNNNMNTLYLPPNGVIRTLECYNNNLSNLDLTGHPDLYYFKAINNLPYLRICVPDAQVASTTWYFTQDPSAVYSEDCYPFAVKGQLVVDDNMNCMVDTAERTLAGQWLKFEKTTDTTVLYFTTYDTLGNYRAYLDTGTYVVSLVPSNAYWQGCPSNQSVTIDTNYILQTLDWTLQEVVSCPLLKVDLAAPFLRSTGGGSAYTISYCNNGTVTAQNAYAVVDLDPALNFISSTTPVLSQSGTSYTFALGNIANGFCGSFQIQVTVDTNAQFEQTHCTEVHIYPDTICSPLWTGPIVEGAVACQNDTVRFMLNNVGTLMSQNQRYRIIQDDTVIRAGVILLGAGQSSLILEPALAGSTYRIEVEQASGYPAIWGDSIFSLAIEGCHPLPNGTFNTGYITQYSNGYSASFKAIDCQPNVGSYDPNDKAAQPVGYGSQHYINQNIAIDYKVRFQNTGTDTAFNIVITDTLSNYVDVLSLEMGASSHDYTWTVENGNVIKVSFSNIMLVDSNANEALSHGFFRYRISQKQNNPIGTLIENQAAIYFDYNPPIFTNTTFHTVGDNFVPVIVAIEQLYEERIEVTAFPNPFERFTTIKVAGKEYNELQLAVFDVSGRLMTQQQVSSNNQIQLSRGNLQAGVYFYQLKGDGKLLNTGKIIVQ